MEQSPMRKNLDMSLFNPPERRETPKLSQIQSIGLPSEIHADRVVSEMVRHIAVKRANLWREIASAFQASGDGNAKSQQRLVAKLKRAGAPLITLQPGKRGRYGMDIYSWIGWDGQHDREIGVKDDLPERPGIAGCMLRIKGKGGGRYDEASMPVLVITHHALSRYAQRGGGRTAQDLEKMCNALWEKTMKISHETKLNSWEAFVNKGPYRIPFANGVAVLEKHDGSHSHTLVAVTVLEEGW